MVIPYCLNIHPGEHLIDIQEAIDRYALAVKAHVAPNTPYPLGLRLGADVAKELATPEACAAFGSFLSQRACYVTGINGFPFGPFHKTSVKDRVYQPDWSTPERLCYTGQLAKILATLLPKGETGNISTVPLGYRGTKRVSMKAEGFGLNEQTQTIMARHLAVMAEFLNDLHQESSREIVLALEPEPDCLLEDPNDVICWYEEVFLAQGVKWLSAHQRRTPDEAEALLRRYIGICLDTCHMALAFEEPLTALIRFESAGIRVARVQLSAALRTTITPCALERLAAFIDPVYLHQTRIQRPKGQLISYADLTNKTLGAAREYEGCELRTHVHVPMFYTGTEALASTHTQLTQPFFDHVIKHAYPLETETYTFDVLPPDVRPDNVVDCLVAEHDWVNQHIM